MAFLSYGDFLVMYPQSALTQAQFNVYERQAERVLDVLTTGIDNVHKLYEHFPTNERDVQNVQDATAHLTNLLFQIDTTSSAYTPTVGADGLSSSRVVASRSSGSESISYASNVNTSIIEATKSEDAKMKLLSQTARFYLAGVEDKNGVNLLYMGAYPSCI